MNDPSWPVEVRSLGRTLKRWRNQIIAWHRAHFTNGPNGSGGQLDQASEARAFGFRRFRNDRARALLYAGKPSWELLAAITPRIFPLSRFSAVGLRAPSPSGVLVIGQYGQRQLTVYENVEPVASTLDEVVVAHERWIFRTR